MQSLTARVFDDGDTEPIDPFAVFEEWFEAARASEPNDANAMALATVDSSGMPDARTVLMNGRSPAGIMFFSNGKSMKGIQLIDNPRAALLFHWKSLFRQVRLRGVVEEISLEETIGYFHTRPHGSQIGAHASWQSRPLASREELLARAASFEAQFRGKDVPRPDDWKGYRLKPVTWEFWRAGEFRLHDRVRFIRSGKGWSRQRLNP
jgi:pyridoxamine 5'-phosphate oxidase